MRLNKTRMKEYGYAALSLFPLYGVAKYAIAYKKTRDLLLNKSAEAQEIQNILDEFPTNQSEYDEFIETADPSILDLYNEALADSKLSGQVSQDFLDSHGFENQEAFFDKLDSLFASGQGDLGAQEEFNALMTDYQNDFFGQATDIASASYHERLLDLGYVDFDPSILDTLMSVDYKTFIIGLFSVGALYVIGWRVCELRKRRAKTREVNGKRILVNPARAGRRGIRGLISKFKSHNNEKEEKHLKNKLIEDKKDTKDIIKEDRNKVDIIKKEDNQIKKETEEKKEIKTDYKEEIEERNVQAEFEEKFLL